MLRSVLITFVFLFFAACGKNDVVANGGYNNNPYGPINGPVRQAPPPSNGGYYPPGGGGYPGGQPPPYFNPQMPPGMPPQYYPWLPMDNYFRRSPQLTQVWINIWTDWQHYANYRGCDVYDFPRFWTEYCPQQWQGPQYTQLYQYFNNSCYSWVGPQTQFPSNVQADYFWSSYVGMTYDSYDNSCGDCWSSYY